MVGIGISLEMTSWLNRASGAWGQYYSSERIILVSDVEGFLYTYNPLHFGLQQVWDVNTYLPTSQRLNLEDNHATFDNHLLGLLLRRFYAFQVLSGGWQSTVLSSGKLLRIFVICVSSQGRLQRDKCSSRILPNFKWSRCFDKKPNGKVRKENSHVIFSKDQFQSLVKVKSFDPTAETRTHS
jgi:hypothetical protein